MAKPIRDRGIRWSENYGEKSAYLKNEMTEQIGTGSYFRWEGHDYTTNTDYYVVVSPGFSKKKGYFFFAGLRKMPADHGASGKKFATQAEALSHAFETWSVPRPLERPAKKYSRDDLVNKPIVMEAQHRGASSDVPGRIIIASDDPDEIDVFADEPMSKEAMALGGLMNECGLGSNWKRLGTQKHFRDILCGAAKESGTMGFLAAMFSRMSIVGVDGANYPSDSQHPYSPKMATAQEVTPAQFANFTAGNWANKDLVERRKNVPEGGYDKTEPWQEESGSGYEQIRWSDYLLCIKVKIPFEKYGNTGSLWDSLERLGPATGIADRAYAGQGGKKLPPVMVKLPYGDRPETHIRMVEEQAGKRPRRRKKHEEVRVAVAPELYTDVLAMIRNWQAREEPAEGEAPAEGEERKGKKGFLQPIPMKNSEKMGNYLSYLAARNEPFNLDEVISEKILLTGSQMLVYDDQGMPFALKGEGDGNYLIPRSQNAPEEDVSSDTQNMLGQFTNSLNGSKQLIADSIFPGILRVNEFMESGLGNRKSLGLLVERGMADPGRGPARGEFIEKCDAYIGARTRAAALSTALQRQGESREDMMLSKAMEIMRAAWDNVAPYFTAFETLASMGLLDLDPGRFVYASTCAPVLTPIFTKGYDINEAGLPNDISSLSAGTTLQSVVPPTQVGAREDGGKNYARMPRVSDSGEYAESYDMIPEGAAPIQQVSGAPLVVSNTRMSLIVEGQEDFATKATEGGVRRFDGNSEGRYIPGAVFSIFARPTMGGSAKTGRGQKISGGVSVDSERYSGEERGGIPTGKSDQTQPESMLPKEAGAYGVTDKDGNAKDLFEHVGLDGEDLVFMNSGAALEFLQNKLCLPPELVGAITNMDARDLEMADDKAHTAMTLFELEAKASRTPEEQAYLDGAKEGMPEAEWDHLMAFGRMCVVCGKTKSQLRAMGIKGEGGDVLGEDLIKMLGDAMENPREAMYPKRGTTWGIKFTDPDTGARDFYKAEGEDMPVMFSSNASPRIKDFIDMLVNQHAKDKGITPREAAGMMYAQAEIVSEDGLLAPSVAGTGGNIVIGGEELARDVLGVAYDENDPWLSDDEGAKPAFDAPGDVAPDEVPGQPPVDEAAEPRMPEVPPGPQEQTEPDVDFAPAGAAPGAPELNQQQQRALQNATNMLDRAATNAGVVPGQPMTPEQASRIQGAANMVKRMFMGDEALNRHLDDYLARIIPAEEPAQPVSPAPAPAPQASVIDKLVRLADSLDNTGRPEEADQVDRLIRASSQA